MGPFLCTTSDVPEGGRKSVQPESLPELVVCNVAGTFYVLAATCSHGEASLAAGRLLGCELECPLHAGRFDVTTGGATRRPAKKPVETYQCVEQDGGLYLTDAASSAASASQAA
ncbi:MAG: hcaC2 [Actinoallomurus sp.]|jgi:nitrite reductase/ring-hydroxylating ferredoxin subunit|nr:hcaC2 [Actinoallomurus sp.]